jgi:hypothetical protein
MVDPERGVDVRAGARRVVIYSPQLDRENPPFVAVSRHLTEVLEMSTATSATVSVSWRIAEDMREIARLRAELGAWLVERRKRDTLQQFKTQLQALEDVLLKALQGLDSELSGAVKAPGLAAVDACRRVERGTVWVRRVWTFFRWRFDQRDHPQFSGVLAAADEMVWSCYVEPFRAAGLDTPPAPLAYLDDRFSPYAVPRIEPPPELRFDVEAAFIRDFLSALPIPLLGLPPAAVEYPWWLALVAHEVGHHVQYDLEPKAALVGDFRTWLESAIGDHAAAPAAGRWKPWGREIFADAWSVAMIGPAALWVLVDLEVGADARLLQSHAAYPCPLLRFALMAALLTELRVSPLEALRGLDPQASRSGEPVIVEGQDFRSRFAEDFAVVPSVAKALAATPIVHDLSLGDLSRWDNADFAPFGTVKKWTDAFEAVDDPTAVETVESARLATSGAVWAWANLAAVADEHRDPSRIRLRNRVLRTVARSREQKVRAATPDAAFAAADAGDKLCALVLNNAPEPAPAP